MTSPLHTPAESSGGISLQRHARKELVGHVVSDKMMKTIVVEIERLVRHPQYEHVIHRRTRFKVHDPEGQAHLGDRVRIRECRPISKDKRWLLVEKLAA